MHVTKCKERISSLSDQAAHFNEEQCKYLAGKLDIALQSVRSIIEEINAWYFSSASGEDMIGCLEILKLLLLTGWAAEGFIEDCHKHEWIQNAIVLTNVSEHVVSMGLNLELCTFVFSRKKLGIPRSLTPPEVTKIRQDEAEIVKEKSDLDKRKLCEALSEVTGLSTSSTEVQLAKFLLGRPQPDVGSIFSMKSLERMESLGKGASAVVHRAIWLGTEVARKTFHGPSNPDFLREVKILEELSHPNVVSLLWHTTDKNRSHLIMELMDGDLSDLMGKRMERGDRDSPFSILETFVLLLQIAEGMLYLHEKRIVHRDLKSANILVKSGKARELDFKHVQVKVADLGLSKTKEKSMTYSQQTLNQGTTKWMAPEMMRVTNDDGEVEESRIEYPFKCDVYSFGMVCFELLTGNVPFSTLSNTKVRKEVLRGGRPQLPVLCPRRLRTLIEACWSANPTMRPGFPRICAELRHLKYEHIMTSVWAKFARSFSLNEIRNMTNEFNEGNRFGLDEVYKVEMVGTGEVVLVERVQYNCDLLSVDIRLKELHHKNLMGYVGYCYENGERIFVFEYMPNYTLAGWFSGDRPPFFYWGARRDICLGIANGIHYLHTDFLAKSLRRSINLRTIFLDANFNPKIAGYWRECSWPKPGSEKEDVYNYGVVILEIVSSRIERGLDSVHMRTWGIDPRLRLRGTEEMEANRFIRIAFLCIHEVAATRPDMARVVAMLQGELDGEIENLRLQHERERSQFPSLTAVLYEPHATIIAQSTPPSNPSHEIRNSM